MGNTRNKSAVMGGAKRTHTLVRYGFKRPKFGRISFSIHEDIIYPDGTRTCKNVQDERLSAVNKAFKIKAQDMTACEKQVKEIVKDLLKKDNRCQRQVVHNHENHKALDQYWEKVYSFRTLENPQSTKQELSRAIDVIGTLSLYAATREQIQNAIDNAVTGNVQRRMVSRITQILKFIGRDDVKLRKGRPLYNKVSHLSEKDFQKLISTVNIPILKALMTVCFYSGVRIGEAYALNPRSLVGDRKDTLRISSQVDRLGKAKPTTKTRKPRLAYILPQGIEAFHYWVNAPDKEKATINRVAVSTLVRAYCHKLFPDNPEKQLTFHALRHSYAIHLLVQGVSMSLVAQSLGNSLSVCQYYYVGFELTDESIAAIRSIVGGSKP